MPSHLAGPLRVSIISVNISFAFRIMTGVEPADDPRDSAKLSDLLKDSAAALLRSAIEALVDRSIIVKLVRMANIVPLDQLIRESARCSDVLSATNVGLIMAALVLIGMVWARPQMMRITRGRSGVLEEHHAHPAKKKKCYDATLQLLADEQGDWYVRLVLEREMGKIYKYYAEHDWGVENENGVEPEVESEVESRNESKREDDDDREEDDDDREEDDDGDEQDDDEDEEGDDNGDDNGEDDAKDDQPHGSKRESPTHPARTQQNEKVADAPVSTTRTAGIPEPATAVQTSAAAKPSEAVQASAAKPSAAKPLAGTVVDISPPKRVAPWGSIVSTALGDSPWQQHLEDCTRAGQRVEYVISPPRAPPSDDELKNAAEAHDAEFESSS
jgi:hypothetical protein